MMRLALAIGVLALGGSSALWSHGQVKASPATGRTCAGRLTRLGPQGPGSRLQAQADIGAFLDEVRTRNPVSSIAPGASDANLSHPLAPDEIAALAARCAPQTPVSLIQALVKVESGGRPLRVAVNGGRPHVVAVSDPEQGRREIEQLSAARANFDTGLMQLNSATLAHLGVSPEEALEPCRNLALGAKLFEQGYARAFADRSATVPLLAAYSSYNTGDLRRGYANGYAGRVDAALRVEARTRSAS